MATMTGRFNEPANVVPVLKQIEALGPTSILDVGAAFGLWGFLLRQHVDGFVYDIRIDGVEAERALLERAPAEELYDTLLAVDFLDPLSAGLNPTYSIVLMDGYLDRVAPDHGRRALNKALRIAATVVVTAAEPATDALLRDFANTRENLHVEGFSGGGFTRLLMWEVR